MPRGRPRKAILPCRFCDTQFKRVEHLTRHERIHTQEKPFRCECGQAFSRKDLLVRHTKINHSGGEKTHASNVESSPTEQAARAESLAHISPDVTTPLTASSSVHPHQSSDDLSNSLPDSHIRNLTIDVSNESQNLAGFRSQTAAQSAPALYSMQRAEEQDRLADSGNTDFLSHQYSFEITSQYLADPCIGAGNDIDLLWDWDLGTHDFLPANLFDTGQSLSDLWRMETPQVDPIVVPVSSPRRSSPTAMLDLDAQHSAIAPPLCQRLPTLEPDYELSNNDRLPIQDIRSSTVADVQQSLPLESPWSISVNAYRHALDAYKPYEPLLDETFMFPSRRTLSRFFEAYFKEFHQHLPFLHIPTATISSLAPELVLAIAAVGAFYRYEDAKGYALFIACKTITIQQIQLQRRPYNSRHSSSISQFSASTASLRYNNALDVAGSVTDRSESEKSEPRHEARDKLQTMQALTIIVALASWSDKPMCQDAIVLASQLSMLVREGGILNEDSIPEGTPWLCWISREERRRTLFAAYVLFNMQSIAFNVPPLILNQDVHLCLPHCGSEWDAVSASEFMHLRRLYGHDERSFRYALEEVLHGRSVHAIGPLSAFGNYVLIVGLVQQIFLEKNVMRSLPDSAASLIDDNVKSYEAALRSWHHSWDATQESSLDPSSPKGPLGFDAAALLWLGYIRLNADIGPNCDLMSKDPHTVALAFMCKDSLRLTRSPHLDRAVLQCIHALSRPIRIGIPFFTRVLAAKRSVQHALCNLECAYLLSRWLTTVADIVTRMGIQSLREDERSLLGMITSLIRETDLAHTLDQNEDDGRSIGRMAATVVKLWADTFGASHVFYIVDAIRITLSIVADMMETKLRTPSLM